MLITIKHIYMYFPFTTELPQSAYINEITWCPFRQQSPVVKTAKIHNSCTDNLSNKQFSSKSDYEFTTAPCKLRNVCQANDKQSFHTVRYSQLELDSGNNRS